MACLDANTVLEFVGGQMAPERVGEVESHLDTCEACRQLLAELAASDVIEPQPALRADAGDRRRVGRYILHERIGQGAMGTVYLARDPTLDRDIALKIVPAERVRVSERLFREARALARLSHAHVTAIYDAGIAGDEVYIAMELVDGGNLAQWLAARRRHWREILEVFGQTARALAAAHAAGLVHRDFKPENVLIDRQGRARVTDFGLVAFLGGLHGEALPEPLGESDGEPPGESPCPRLTRTGALLGTPAYMAPEQLLGQPATALSDQFSFCAALYEALFDQRPFAGEHFDELRARVLAGDIRPVPKSEVPRAVVRALWRGLQASPQARHASMDALLGALRPPRWPRMAMAATAIATMGVVVALVSIRSTDDGDEKAAACSAALHDQLGAIWGPERSRATLAALHRTLPPQARHTAAQTVDRLDRYAHAMAASRDRACQAGASGGTQAELQLRGNATCLDLRARMLAAVVAQASAPDPEVARYLYKVAEELAPVELCDLAEATVGAPELPRGPGAAAELARIYGDLVRVHALRHAGQFRRALDSAVAVASEARALGFTPAMAEALVLRGKLEFFMDRDAAAEATLVDAVAAAETARADHVRAEALVALTAIMGHQPGREEEAHRFEALARSAIERSSTGAYLERAIEWTEGTIRFTRGQYEAALQHFQKARELAEAQLDPQDPNLPLFAINVAATLVELGRLEEASALEQQVMERVRHTFDPEHPMAAHALLQRMSKAGPGECSQNLHELERVRARMGEAYGHAHDTTLGARKLVASCLYHLGRHDEALEELGAVLKLQTTQTDADIELAMTHVDLGDVHAARGAHADAEAAYRRAIELIEARLGRDDVRLGWPLTRLGKALLRAGHTADSVEQLTRALDIYVRAGVPDLTMAETRFALALALARNP